jgi:hypothetical protein
MGVRRVRLKQHYKFELIFGCKNPLKMIEQHFEYIAVVDFEATCEQHQETDYRNEIIEFPIVLINVQEQTIVNNSQQIKFIDTLLFFIRSINFNHIVDRRSNQLYRNFVHN